MLKVEKVLESMPKVTLMYKTKRQISENCEIEIEGEWV